MLVRLVQLANAKSPMLVTLTGSVILVRPAQLENAELPMLVRPAGSVMFVRLVQDWNAQSPMLVIPTGIVTLFRAVRSEKADAAIAPTGSPAMVLGIATTAAEPLYPVIVTCPLLIAYVKSAAGLAVGAVGIPPNCESQPCVPAR